LGQQGRRFDLVFADPPYGARVVQQILEGVAQSGVLTPGGTLLVEHDKREDAAERHGALVRTDQRRFGDTLVSFYVAEAAPA
jgi:16S rRNA (guanine966-N2)-methyltransferase